jgi:hypothetical protein
MDVHRKAVLSPGLEAPDWRSRHFAEVKPQKQKRPHRILKIAIQSGQTPCNINKE